MPKVKTTDRLKRHRYQPTKVPGDVSNQENTLQLPDSLMPNLDLNPSNVMEALKSESVNEKLSALHSLASMMTSQEEARPLIKKNLTGQLMKLLEPVTAVDFTLEATGVLRNLSFVAPEDTLNEWIQLKLISKLHEILPKITDLLSSETVVKSKVYQFVENVFTIFCVLCEYSEKATAQLKLESVAFAVKLLCACTESPSQPIPFTTFVLILEYLMMVANDTELCDQFYDSDDNAAAAFTDLLLTIAIDSQSMEKLSFSDKPHYEQVWMKIMAAGCLADSGLVTPKQLGQLLAVLQTPIDYPFDEKIASIVAQINQNNEDLKVNFQQRDFGLLNATQQSAVELLGMMKNAQSSFEILAGLFADDDTDECNDEDMEEDEEPMEEVEEVGAEESAREDDAEKSESTRETATKLQMIQISFVNSNCCRRAIEMMNLYGVFLANLGIKVPAPLPMPPTHPMSTVLTPLSESLFQLQVAACGCINNFFSSLTVNAMKSLETAMLSPDLVFERLVQVALDTNQFHIQQLPDNWPQADVECTRQKLFERNCMMVDKLLTALWSLGRSLIDTCARHPNPASAINILDRIVQLYQVLGHEQSTNVVRMKVISVIGVLSCHPQLPADVAIAMAEFLLGRMEGQPNPNEPSPVVQAELMNAFMDIFGPDTHNAVFSRANWLPRLKAAMPTLKKQMKQIDPRVRSLQQLQQQKQNVVDNRVIKERMREMLFNMARFIQYKENMERAGR